MREWSRVRWVLILLGFAVGGAGLFALKRSGSVSGIGRDRDMAPQAHLVRWNEERRKQIEELERIYREEILPMRDQLRHDAQQFEAMEGTLYPEVGAVVSSPDRGGRPSGEESEETLSWLQVREVLLDVLRDQRIRGEAGTAGQGGGQTGDAKPLSNHEDGPVQ
jgi:hypothetical protein